MNTGPRVEFAVLNAPAGFPYSQINVFLNGIIPRKIEYLVARLFAQKMQGDAAYGFAPRLFRGERIHLHLQVLAHHLKADPLADLEVNDLDAAAHLARKIEPAREKHVGFRNRNFDLLFHPVHGAEAMSIILDVAIEIPKTRVTHGFLAIVIPGLGRLPHGLPEFGQVAGRKNAAVQRQLVDMFEHVVHCPAKVCPIHLRHAKAAFVNQLVLKRTQDVRVKAGIRKPLAVRRLGFLPVPRRFFLYVANRLYNGALLDFLYEF